MSLPRWFRHHKQCLAAPTNVHARAAVIRLDGEAHLSAEKVKQLIWKKYHLWPTVARAFIHREHISMAGIKITWSPPATRIDGTAVDTSQYGAVIVQQLQADGSYTDLPPLGGDQTSLVVANALPGNYVFNVRYVDVQGQQGASSADVGVVVPDAKPAQLSAPTAVTAEVVA